MLVVGIRGSVEQIFTIAFASSFKSQIVRKCNLNSFSLFLSLHPTLSLSLTARIYQIIIFLHVFYSHVIYFSLCLGFSASLPRYIDISTFQSHRNRTTELLLTIYSRKLANNNHSWLKCDSRIRSLE